MNVDEATAADIERLADALGNKEFFADRYKRQKDSKGMLFIAWLDGRPVGDVYLWLEPAEEYQIRRFLPGVPLLTHLEVLPEYRNRGFGTELIKALEAYLLGIGKDRVALAVRDDNTKAMELYRRLGYEDWGHGKQVCFANALDAEHPTVEPELCYVMVRQLHSMSPSSDSTFSSRAS